MAKPSRAALEAEIRFLRQGQNSRTVASIANNLIRWAGLGVIAYFAYRSIDALAGKETTANVMVNFLASIKANQWAAWIAGGGGTIYGLRQRSLRRKTIARLQKRNTDLESKIDPNRTSSGLTERGETDPKDEA